MTLTVTLLYFAALRDSMGRSEETLALPAEVRTVRELSLLLASRTNLGDRLATVRIAVNETFVEPSHLLQDGDVVALIPPVSGG